MNKRPITIKDIAKKLGVSPSTVSRAIHDHPDLNPDTKKRICKLVDQLGYRPNSIAQSLSRKYSNVIGVQVPEIKRNFFASVISGIENVAYDEGYTIITCQSNENYEREIINLQSMVSHQVAGIIISISQMTRNSDYFKSLMEHQMPLVFFDRVLNDLDTDKVVVDDFDGAFQLVSHLIEAGYKRIAHIAGPEIISISENRLLGYLEALKIYNLPVNQDYIIRGGFQEEAGYDCFKKLLELEEKPDAVFTVNAPVAAGVYKRSAEIGLKIPDDIAVAGFSDNTLSAWLIPQMTTAVQPGFEMGTKAIKILLDRIKDKNEKIEPITEVLKTELLIRGSTVKNKL